MRAGFYHQMIASSIYLYIYGRTYSARAEDICLQVGNPLFAVLGDAQIAHGLLDIPVDMVPVKLGVVFPQIPGRLYPNCLLRPSSSNS